MSKEKIDRPDDTVGIQACTLYPFAQWKGKEHSYAITVDVKGLDDVTKPNAKMNLVVDNKIVHSISIQDMIQGYFNL